MSEIKQIRNLYYEEGMKISEISRDSGSDRKTVRKYLEQKDWNQDIPKPAVQPGFYKLDKYKPEIDSWLTEDKKAKRKQRHTAKRVYNRLVEIHKEKFDCSYRTVAGYVAMRKKEIYGGKKGHLPLEHFAGEAQADFGDAQYYENGKLYDGKYLNLSFPNSNNGYLQLFKGGNQECLFEGLINIFNHIDGVPTVIWFDNASSIVKKVLKDGKRDLTDAFMRFEEHYGFKSNFCNTNSGHEKGNVEAKVGYHRRNMLVPVPKFHNLVDFNKELLQRCDNDAKRDHYRKNATIEELFEQDKSELLVLPKNCLDVSKYITVKTNDYGRFYLNGGIHEYSVAPKFANSRIVVKLTANEVIPLDDSQRPIVHHERFYGKEKQQSMKWIPYLKQLSRYPGALKYSGIYTMLPDPLRDYLDKCDKSTKGQVLNVIAAFTEKKGFASAVSTIDHALNYEVNDSDSLISLFSRINEEFPELPPLNLSHSVPCLQPINCSLNTYDSGLTVMRGGSQ